MGNWRLAVFLPFLFLLSACAGGKTGTISPTDYVEIDNPAFTMSKDAPATILVPKRYVETGVPRGGELLKKGYEVVKQETAGSESAHAVTVGVPADATTFTVKNTIIALEVGRNGLLPLFQQKLKNLSTGILLDFNLESFARYGSASSQVERLALSKRLYQDIGSNLVLFIIAAEQSSPAERIMVEIYDGMGGGLLRQFAATIPAYDVADPSARNKAIASVLGSVAGMVKEVSTLVPWYGRIISVDGEKVYINAGKEAGVRLGQQMKIYREGKFVASLGFAPGEAAGRLEIKGFVGPNGAYGTVTDGLEVRLTDVVGIE
ncbi:hypothetical protein SAMN06269301_0948 [Geobacter sp. DSM 9736]|nr:hypothetical protein SAMN06269301_0948 [Geobacter sp. DSM 9736]